MEPLVEIDHASYVAGRREILRDASWTIRRGERWAVLGPNGAGKTTLLRIAGGYLWPNAGGIVKRLGRELLDLRELRRNIGWVANTQNAKIPPREQAIDTVVSGSLAQLGLTHHHGCEPTNDAYTRAEALLDRLQCTGLRSKPFGVLSQGEQQAVLLARALMAEPMLVVLDEPCAGLDPGARERFLKMLAAMLEQDATTSIVMVTHHVAEILPQVDQVLTMQDGQITASGPSNDMLTPESISRLYSTPVRQLIVSGGRVWPVW